MADKTMRLEIVTPARAVFKEDVEFLVAPGIYGELGILPEHAPLITALNIGILRIDKDGRRMKVAVSGGFLEVKNNKVVVLADTAERAEEIDVERAQAAKERAEKRLAAGKGGDIDVVRAELALKRALNRIKAVQ